MAFLIDTSLLVRADRGELQDPLSAVFESQLSVSVITLAELRRGVLMASPESRAKRVAFVGTLVSKLTMIPIDERVAEVHAHLWSQLKEVGKPVPENDLWIASTAIARGLPVATLDRKHFSRIPGLEVLVPDS